MKTDLSQFINYKPKGKHSVVVYGDHLSLLDFKMDEVLKITNLVDAQNIKLILHIYDIEEK